MGIGHTLQMAGQPLVLASCVAAASFMALSLCAPAAFAQSQVFIVEMEHQQNLPAFKPTSVALDSTHLTARGHRELITAFTAEQGFARRPLPLDSHGLVLHANGELKPDGVSYEEMLQRKGISAKAGDRIVITDIQIASNKIVFEFNGGPDHKHKVLRHISIGAGGADMPLARDDGQEPVGSRLTLAFDGYVPEMTPDQVRGLIQPVMDFSVKTPLEAYVDTLPPKLKDAILNHHVLVGMDRKMVVYALGAPQSKVREDTNGVAFEEWIYGEAPKPVQFVRFQGNRVTQVEVGAVGQDLAVRQQDETGGYLASSDIHTVNMGDATPSTNGDSTHRAAPTLRMPGEEPLPGTVQQVQMPKDKPDARPQPIPAEPTTAHLTGLQ